MSLFRIDGLNVVLPDKKVDDKINNKINFKKWKQKKVHKIKKIFKMKNNLKIIIKNIKIKY